METNTIIYTTRIFSNLISNDIITKGISDVAFSIYGILFGLVDIKNPELEKLLIEKGKNTSKVWDQILADEGSVQNLPSDTLSEDEKEVFLTFAETNQLALVQQAAIRQKYIDQTQSLNLAFSPTDSPKWINQVHMEAWKLGVKTLYYLRTDSVIKGDLGSRMADCVACDG